MTKDISYDESLIFYNFKVIGKRGELPAKYSSITSPKAWSLSSSTNSTQERQRAKSRLAFDGNNFILFSMQN